MELLPEDVLDRARGALMGALVGDALGTTLEFMRYDEVRRRHPKGHREIVGGGPFRLAPGQVTDDGELTLALARSIVEVGRYDPDQAATAYRRWYESGPVDIGNATRQAFGRVKPGPGIAVRMMRVASSVTEANGALMRSPPLGIFGWRMEPKALEALASVDVALSHPSEPCRQSNVVYTQAIALAVAGVDRREVLDRVTRYARSTGLDWAAEALRDAQDGPPRDYYTNMGWVRLALQSAMFWLGTDTSFEEALVATVNQGGDSDTNGCITGALLGAALGERAIPGRWRRAVLECQSLRPAEYQAAQGPELSARLVALGAQIGP